MRSGWYGLPILAVLLGLTGCGSQDEAARAAAQRVDQKVAELRDAATAGAPSRRFSRLRVADGPYIGIAPAPARTQVLPEEYRSADAVTLPVADIGDAALLGSRIEAATGLQVRFVGEALDPATERAALSRGLFGTAMADALAPVGGVWTGPLPALLDGWTEAAGYEWRYDADSKSLEVIRSRTVIFQIHALSVQQNYRTVSSTQDQAGESGASNLSSQEIRSEMEYAPWAAIETQLGGLIGEGAALTFSASSGSVAVHGSPREIGRVRAYLEYLNRVVLRPVNLSVHVYSVSFERGADYQFGLNFLLRELFGESDLRFEVSGDSVSVVKTGIEPPEGVPALGNTLAATVRALSRAGTVSRVLSADVPSLNGAPAQFFELVQEAYLKELKVTLSDGVAQTELTPGTISSGFAMSYVPRITGPDEVLVRLIASLQDRPTFREFASAQQVIQLPVYGSRAIQVSQRIRRGETLVVSGFSDDAARSDRGGTFAPGVPLPEGHRRGTVARVEQVLLVTAEVGAPLGISEVEGAAL